MKLFVSVFSLIIVISHIVISKLLLTPLRFEHYSNEHETIS